MQLVKPSVTVITEPDIMKRIELAGRTCYASQDKITDGSAEPFVRNLINRGHESVLEHSNIIVKANKTESILWLETLIEEYTRFTNRPHFIRHKYAEEDTYADGLNCANHKCAKCGTDSKVIPRVYVGDEPYFSGMAIGNALMDMWDEMKCEVIADEDREDQPKVTTQTAKKIPQNKNPSNICPTCGSSLIAEGGCSLCKGCGWSKCS